jgi:hypothetical protein
MAPLDQPSDSMTYNDGENEDENQKTIANDDYQNDRRRQQQGNLGKSHMYAEEIDDNLDYGSVDD